MFQIKTQANVDVYLDYIDTKIHTKTLDDGYFEFCVPLDQNTNYGWIPYQVHILHKGETIYSTENYIRPHKGNLGIISDIDDTFLVSHTTNPFKKLYVLLFKNINKRRIFDEVVSHYQALSTAGRENNEEQNAFFYVSSSEWNLYRFIIKFTELHNLPKAVLLLKDIKTSLKDFIFTRYGNHDHKFDKIKHILEFYPNLEYVLLGDDSQRDVFLYEAIAKIFPVTVKAVYIRQTTIKQKSKVIAALKNLESLDVATCYFKHSTEAITHSKSIGIIK
jgi:phosphatidate phosphatase APP1